MQLERHGPDHFGPDASDVLDRGVQQTGVYLYPLATGSARPNPKKGAPDTKSFMHRVPRPSLPCVFLMPSNIIHSNAIRAACARSLSHLTRRMCRQGPKESQTRSSKQALRELKKVEGARKPANPVATLCQPFANLFCQPRSQLLFLWARGTRLDSRP